MSAIKSDLKSHFEHEMGKLPPPWCILLTHALPLKECLDLVATATHMDVSGVYVKNTQYTFEKLAARCSGDAASLLYVLHGLAMSNTTGEVHTHLLTYQDEPWLPKLFSVRIHNEPIFVSACRRQLREFAGWMLDVMGDTNDYTALAAADADGNTTLHFSVMRQQWEWSKWLIDKGCSPLQPNVHGKTPLMCAAPHREQLCLFKKDGAEWFHALHNALVDGREHAEWCNALIEEGADVNQLALYDSPEASLTVFAKHGMDMNLGPVPEHVSASQFNILLMHGHEPVLWSKVIESVEDDVWLRLLHQIHFIGQVPANKDYEKYCTFVANIKKCQAIADKTYTLQKKIY